MLLLLKDKIINTLICSVICDAVQDITVDEQVNICVSWCFDKLEPQESLMGFYKTGVTCGITRLWFSP